MMIANINVFPKSIYLRQSEANQHGLWLDLLRGPLAYTVYFSAGYLLLQVACRIPLLHMMLGGLSLCAILLLTLTLLSALITLLTGLSNFRRLRQRMSAHNDEAGPWAPLLLHSGVLLSVFFTGLILLTGIPFFVVESCGWL
jgi:hypothetical protein